MLTTSTTPAWAVELTNEVCRDYKRAIPRELKWFQSGNPRDKYTGGTTWRNGKIFIRAGYDQYDQQLVLLHELAHHLINKSKKGRKMGHSIKFWKLAFELYKRYGVEPDYALYREETYRVKATEAYNWLMSQ